jgi:hypothetical protein
MALLAPPCTPTHPALQFSRLGLLCAAIFVMTLLGADGVPLVLQPRDVPGALEGLAAIPDTGYHYVILHAFVFTVTHRQAGVRFTLPRVADNEPQHSWLPQVAGLLARFI